MKGKTQSARGGAQQTAAKRDGQTGGKRQGSKQDGKESRRGQRGK
jgi:hypothetical protein